MSECVCGEHGSSEGRGGEGRGWERMGERRGVRGGGV